MPFRALRDGEAIVVRDDQTKIIKCCRGI